MRDGPKPVLGSRVVNRLRLAAGGIVSIADLIEACYPDPDLEPEWPNKSVHRAIHRLRRMEFPIRSHKGRGYSYAWRQWEVLSVPAPAP